VAEAPLQENLDVEEEKHLVNQDRIRLNATIDAFPSDA
jgi:hypothetical protein